MSFSEAQTHASPGFKVKSVHLEIDTPANFEGPYIAINDETGEVEKVYLPLVSTVTARVKRLPPDEAIGYLG